VTANEVFICLANLHSDRGHLSTNLKHPNDMPKLETHDKAFYIDKWH
jgi:hypothetical protein